MKGCDGEEDSNDPEMTARMSAGNVALISEYIAP